MLNKEIILKITSVFENNTPELQYNYCEALGDGRGYTFGYCGFTTGTGDGYEVIQLLSDTSLSKFLPRLEELAKNEDGSIEGLEGFETEWKVLGSSEEAISAQQEIGDKLYWSPAIKHAEELNWQSPLAIACLYDTIIQHGNGDDPDSLGSIISKIDQSLDEKQAVVQFLEKRKEILENATDPATREEWKWSTPRVEALKNLIKDENWDLNLPICIHSSDFNVKID
jgi:chitosanase